MALDIGIKSPTGSKDPLERDLVSSLEFQQYSFLMDYLATFTEKTGIHIDPYDDAQVIGVQLDTLEKCILKARDEIRHKPEEWVENIGFSIKPKKQLYDRIQKKKFLSEMNKLLTLIQRARDMDRPLLFFGD